MTTHPLRDGHPDDAALGDTPLVSLGQGDYRKDIMPGDVSKGHTRQEEAKALDALTRDAQRSGTVPLADKKPSVLPTLTPITTQVRKLEVPDATRALIEAEAANDQDEAYVRDHVPEIMDLAEAVSKTEGQGGSVLIKGDYLHLVRRVLCVTLFRAAKQMQEGGAS